MKSGGRNWNGAAFQSGLKHKAEVCFYLLREKALKVVEIIENPASNQSLKNYFFQIGMIFELLL